MFINIFETTKKIFTLIIIIFSIAYLILLALKNIKIISFASKTNAINIKFLKIQFQRQSKINMKDYILDLNSREMYKNMDKLKLTEKEINTIIYLSNSNVSVSIDELRKQVWSYQSNMETHTVETHIYRLRQKIFSTFGDNEFIISKKDGYQIKLVNSSNYKLFEFFLKSCSTLLYNFR